MINFYDQVPSVYTSASRDFQYLSWLINIVLNSVKHNVDSIYSLPSTTNNSKLTELLAMTLGFKIRRNYDEKQLAVLVSILPSVLRYKGTKKAIEMAAKALVKATGSTGEARVEVTGTEVQVTLPKDILDVTLFLDLLAYILPAGMTYRVVRKSEDIKEVDDIQVRYYDNHRLKVTKDLRFERKTNEEARNVGLAELFDLPITEVEDAVYAVNVKDINNANIIINSEDESQNIVNTGLLSNLVIPTLENSRLAEVDEEANSVILYSSDGKQLLADGEITLKATKTLHEL